MQRKLLIVTSVPLMLRGFLLPFAEHFKDLGWQVDAMVKADNSTAYKDCEAVFDKIWNVAWSRSPFDPRNFLSAPKMIRAALEAEPYDIVHVHSPIAAFVTRFALRGLRKSKRPKVIYTAHGFHFHREGGRVKNFVFEILERTAGPWTDKLVVINREDEASAKRLKLVPERDLLYMPGIGVDVEKYAARGITTDQLVEVRSELNLAERDRLILMIAEFNPGKRHADALDALALLEERDVVLAFAGVGPLEEEVKVKAEELGVTDRIRMLGYRRDIPVLLKASDALLLPSEREGLPRSVLEAMCAGTPVISTEIRGVEDLLSDDCGLMTPVGDAPAIAKAMRWIADNSEAAKEMAGRGQEKMKLFSLENVIALHEDLYEDVLGPQGVEKITMTGLHTNSVNRLGKTGSAK